MNETQTAVRGAGRPHAPHAFSWTDWRAVLMRTKDTIGEDNVGLAAAGVAFYALLALFPAIATIISLWGLVADPESISRQIERTSAMLPPDAAGIIIDQARKVAMEGDTGVTLAAVAGIAISLYSSTKGVTALMNGLNLAYDEIEQRGFIKRTGLVILLSVGIILGALVAIAFTMVLPAIFGQIGLSGVGAVLAYWLRWPILFLLVVTGLAVMYRWAPDRRTPHWKWVSPGALLGTILWVAGSFLFSLYVQHFGSYNETYGSLGAVIIALMWFWLSAFIVLLGAELNAEMERHAMARERSG